MSHDHDIRRLRAQGLTYNRISETLGIAKGTVASALYRMRRGVDRSVESSAHWHEKFDHAEFVALVALGFNADQLTIAMNRPKDSVVNHAKWTKVALPEGLSPYKTARVRMMALAGATVGEIAAAVKADPRVVQAKCIVRGWRYPDENCPETAYLYAWSAEKQRQRPIPSPPSSALLRLAHFDPVFERALRIRIAQRNENVEFYGLHSDTSQ